MHQVDPKDGYSVSDCRVDRNRRLLEFPIPIVHPDKPTLLLTEDPAESMAYGHRENLKSFTSILSVNGATRLRLLTHPFSQKPITCAPNICHTYRSHVQGLLVN